MLGSPEKQHIEILIRAQCALFTVYIYTLVDWRDTWNRTHGICYHANNLVSFHCNYGILISFQGGRLTLLQIIAVITEECNSRQSQYAENSVMAAHLVVSPAALYTVTCCAMLQNIQLAFYNAVIQTFPPVLSKYRVPGIP